MASKKEIDPPQPDKLKFEKERSLRASAHTGVAIPLDSADSAVESPFPITLGDCHAPSGLAMTRVFLLVKHPFMVLLW